MKSGWTDEELEKLAEELLREYSQLSFDELLAAIRECEPHFSRGEGWEATVRCVREHLNKKCSGQSG